jgi:hypothetical protein
VRVARVPRLSKPFQERGGRRNVRAKPVVRRAMYAYMVCIDRDVVVVQKANVEMDGDELELTSCVRVS